MILQPTSHPENKYPFSGTLNLIASFKTVIWYTFLNRGYQHLKTILIIHSKHSKYLILRKARDL